MSIWRRRHADTGTCKPRRAFKENECKWPMRRACRRARLRKITWHVLRHTFASHLVMSGVPLKAVQELMGHTTIEMTLRYSHLSTEVGRSAVQLLDRHGNSTATGTTPISPGAPPSGG
jgi:integrase